MNKNHNENKIKNENSFPEGKSQGTPMEDSENEQKKNKNELNEKNKSSLEQKLSNEELEGKTLKNNNEEIEKLLEQINEQSEKISNLEKEVEEYKDRLIRKIAEFDNFKKRTENDQIKLIEYAAEDFIKKLLPIVDDFERSLIHINESVDINSLKEGINMIYNKLIKLLNEQGVKPIECVGKPFDVHLHDALMKKKENDFPPQTVLEEVQKGYLFKDKVIRHSKVIVNDDFSEIDSQNNNSEQAK